jgi:hypothetical protein
MVQKIFTGWRFKIISSLLWFGSLISAIGGTSMQIGGICRNCICYTGADNWLNIYNINLAVKVASDKLDARNSSRY